MQAILTGKEIIDEPVIMRAVRLLSIEIPKKYAKGSYISDFTDEAGYEPVDDVEEVKGPAEENVRADCLETLEETVPRLYAKPRGRKKAQRDPMDLLELLKLARSPEAMMSALDKYNMLEVVKC